MHMYRRSNDAIITDSTPAEMRLLFPYVIGLSGEFNNTSVALAATNLFTVRIHHFCDARIACDIALLLWAAWHAACTARVHGMHVGSQALRILRATASYEHGWVLHAAPLMHES